MNVFSANELEENLKDSLFSIWFRLGKNAADLYYSMLECFPLMVPEHYRNKNRVQVAFSQGFYAGSVGLPSLPDEWVTNVRKRNALVCVGIKKYHFVPDLNPVQNYWTFNCDNTSKTKGQWYGMENPIESGDYAARAYIRDRRFPAKFNHYAALSEVVDFLTEEYDLPEVVVYNAEMESSCE